MNLNKRQRIILFSSGPFPAEFHGKVVECTATVFMEGLGCWDLGFMAGEEKHERHFGSSSHLHILWRAVEIISRLTQIDDDDLSHAYEAARRHNSHYQEDVRIIAEKLGKETYEEVFTLPMPQEIVQIFIDNAEALRSWVLHYAQDFEEEILAGVVPWNDAFKHFGVRSAEQLKQIEPFKPLISSFAEHVDIPEGSALLFFMEHALLELIRNGVDQMYPADEVVTLARLGYEWVEESFWEFRTQPSVEKRKEILRQAVQWLNAHRQQMDTTFIRQISEGYFPLRYVGV